MATIVGKAKFDAKDAEEVAKSLKTAMKGLGTDEKRIITELVAHNNQQRQLIKEKYITMYGRSLEEDLTSELGGKFEKVVVKLLKPRFEYEAECVKNAIQGLGTDERVLIDFLCTKEADELQILKTTFKNLYHKDLDVEVKGEANGDLGKVLRSITSANRPKNGDVDYSLAQLEAQKLYDAGEGQLGTDESELIRILASRSFSQLNATFEKYKKICGKDIERVIKSETSGDFEKALVAIIESVRNRPAYFAKRIRDSIQGAGTNDSNLIRLIVSRSEFDLADIKQEYLKMYGKPLYDALKSELSGDYEDIMLAILGK